MENNVNLNFNKTLEPAQHLEQNTNTLQNDYTFKLKSENKKLLKDLIDCLSKKCEKFKENVRLKNILNKMESLKEKYYENISKEEFYHNIINFYLKRISKKCKIL